MCDKQYIGGAGTGGGAMAGRAIDPGLLKDREEQTRQEQTRRASGPARGLGPEVPSLYALDRRIESAQREMNSLLLAREFLQNDTPTGQQTALGLTALRACGYGL